MKQRMLHYTQDLLPLPTVVNTVKYTPGSSRLPRIQGCTGLCMVCTCYS
jgi:hypothetical protein